MKLTKEEFEAWRESPMTEIVMRALQSLADRHKQRWVDLSWNSGISDRELLLELRHRASAFEEVVGMTFEGLQEELE